MPLRTIVCRKICSPPRQGLAVGYVFLQHSNSALVLGSELVLFVGEGDCCGSDIICLCKRYRQKLTVTKPAACKSFSFAVLQSYVLNSLNDIWSFFDDDKLFYSVEPGHFKIFRSALALLLFPVQCSINPNIKWSLGYLISMTCV